MEIKRQLMFLLNVLFVIALRLSQSSAESSGESSEKSGLVHDDNLAVESVKNEKYFPAISKSVLNDGKPFYVDRDPETGKFDFYNIKTVGVQNNIDIDVKDFALEKQKDAKHQNLHDLLHLPVKYTSSKSVYPFISGSYANLKYQGNNNRPISSNHKNYTTQLQSVSKAPVFTPITQTTTTEKEKVTTEASTVPTTTPTTTKMTTTTFSTTTTTTTTARPSPTTTSTRTETSSAPTTKLSSKITTNRPATTIGLVKFQTDLPTTQKIIYNRTELTVQPLQVPNAMLPSGFKPKPNRPAQNRPNEATQKITFQDSNDPSTMSLSELFNVFGKVSADNLTSSEQQAQHIPYDSNGSAIMSNKQPAITSVATQPPTTTTSQPKTTAVNNFFPVDHDHDHLNSHHYDQVVFESSPDDQYVKYDIQGTNTNLVQFKDISSINNIVIHPDQNSASFILGSKQSFSSKSPSNQMPVGSSVDVPISQAQSAYHTLKKDLANKKQETKAPIASNDVRFPDSDPNNKFNDAPIVIGNVKVQGPNPLAFTQTHPAHMSSKPSTITLTPGQYTNFAEIEVPVKFSTDQVGIGNVNVNDIYEKITNKHIKQEQTKRYDGPIRPQLHLKPNTPPMLGRVEPYMQQLRPPLPNVLPQIRPNAKSSHGHPPPGYNVAFPHGELPMSLNRVPLPKIGLPLNPDGGRYPQRRISVPNQYNKFEDANRRVYNPPIPQKQLTVDPLGLKPPPIQQVQPMPPIPQRQFYNRFPSYNKPYPAALQSLSPPRGPEIKKEVNASSLEPVITLQMLQSKKGVSKLNFPSPKQESPLQLESQQQPNGQQSSLYVVYPVVPTEFDPNNLNATTTIDNAVNNGNVNNFNSANIRNENSETPVIGSEYQNTPFSVDSHFEQTPLLVLKDKRKPQQQFPYRIEKPDPSIFVPTKSVGKPSSAELSPFIDRTDIDDEDILYNIGERPSDGKPISSTLVRVTDRPIAIAYTPTTKRYYTPNHYPNEYPSANYDNRISHHSGSEEVPPYRESYEFQAPFQASINLENVAKDVQAGWSVINSPTKRPTVDYSSSSIETNSEDPIKRFDPNSFQPEFLTGFQPIYTSSSDNSHREPLNSNNEQIVPKNKNSETKSVVPSSSSNSNKDEKEIVEPSTPVYVKNEPEKPAKEVEETTKKEEDSISSLADLLKEFIGGDDEDSSKE